MRHRPLSRIMETRVRNSLYLFLTLPSLKPEDKLYSDFLSVTLLIFPHLDSNVFVNFLSLQHLSFVVNLRKEDGAPGP